MVLEIVGECFYCLVVVVYEDWGVVVGEFELMVCLCCCWVC